MTFWIETNKNFQTLGFNSLSRVIDAFVEWKYEDYFDWANSQLSNFHLAAYSSSVPISADVFAVCS